MKGFQKGHKKIEGSGMQKGQIQEKKQAWLQLGDFILNQGVERYLSIINSLPDEQYLDRFENILEYFKPKLSRSQTDITIDQPIIWQEINYNDIQPETNISTQIPT